MRPTRTLRLLTALLVILAVPMALDLRARGAQQREAPFFIYDPQGLLESQTAADLEAVYTGRAEAYRCGIYVVLFERFPSSSFSTVFDYAQYVYKEVGLGVGEAKDGILLLICTKSRDVSICVYGDWAQTAVTDYGREKILYPAFMKDLRGDDWDSAVTHFLEACDKLMVNAVNGKPVDISLPRLIVKALLLALLPGMGVGLVLCQCMKAGMNNVRQAGQAAAYVTGMTQLRVKEDHYLRTTAQHIPRTGSNSGYRGGGGSSGGGFLGGGTRSNSRGFSGSSRKF